MASIHYFSGNGAFASPIATFDITPAVAKHFWPEHLAFGEIVLVNRPDHRSEVPPWKDRFWPKAPGFAGL